MTVEIYRPVGVDVDRISSTAEFKLGTIAEGAGTEWVYVKDSGSGVTGAGYVVVIDESWSAAMLSTSNDARGDIVGVPNLAVTASYYFWAQRKGPAASGVRVAASCAANARVNTTATGGQLDDDGTTGAFQIDGLVLTTANGGSAGLAAAQLDCPIIGAVLP